MTSRTAAVLTLALLDARQAIVLRAGRERGQGTVEYVALILLVAGVLAAVVTWAKKSGDSGIGAKVVKTLKDSIDGVEKGR